jgi:hypothetical protein
MFIHVERVASASTVISTYDQRVYIGAAPLPRNPSFGDRFANKKPPSAIKPIGATKGKNNQQKPSTVL